MTNDELLDMTRALLPESERADETAIAAQLEVAKSAVVSWLFSMSDRDATFSDVPEMYHVRVCEIASYLMARRGSEGEVSHSENGTSRTWGAAHVPVSMLRDMTPKAGVPA